MLTTIEGTYENGVILLKEKPERMKKVKVIVTFLEDSTHQKEGNQIVFGTLKGKVNLSDDFNEPLDSYTL